jgi:hypothetical protein
MVCRCEENIKKKKSNVAHHYDGLEVRGKVNIASGGGGGGDGGGLDHTSW